MRAAIYARVSTPEQHIEPQLHDLRRYVEARGWTLVLEQADHGVSGAKAKRPGLDVVMAAARRRETDAVVVPAFDRFARSVPHLMNALEEFRTLGIQFISLREQVDTSTPLGRMVFTVVAAVAELERELTRERVRVGMAAAKRRGKRIGRPRRAVDLPRARRLMGKGRSQRQVARTLGVSAATLCRSLRAQDGPRAAIGEGNGLQQGAAAGTPVAEGRSGPAVGRRQNHNDRPPADPMLHKD